jgi:hypothetical protein
MTGKKSVPARGSAGSLSNYSQPLSMSPNEK